MKDRRRIKKRVAARNRRKPNSSRPLHQSATRTGAQARKFASLLRQTVDQLLPPNSKVLVISKGDQNLIEFDTCRGAHFPQKSSGTYWFYPASSAAAICHLEAVRFQGAEYLVAPATAGVWLETYPDFIRHLQRRYAVTQSLPDIATIYGLRQRSHWLELDEAINDFKINFNREAAILNWDSEFQFSEIFPECRWFQLPSAKSDVLPYLDKTIDFVVVSAANPARLEEARRVAAAGLIIVKSSLSPSSTPSLSVERLSDHGNEKRPFVSIIVTQSDVDLPLEQRLAFLRETVPPGLRYETLVLIVNERAQKQLDKTNKKRKPPEGSRQISAIADAKTAKGDIVIFIGPNMLPLAGWLSPVLRLFSEQSDAGVVSGRLINFDGTQNHIGGIAGRNESVELLGTDEVDPASPAYGFVRELDFCATRFVATRGSLMRRFAIPPNFGIGDVSATVAYCSAVRDHGYRVYFEPDCWVITYVPATTGFGDRSRKEKRPAVKFSHNSDPSPVPGNGSHNFQASQ
jgi:hypothetical protein